MIGLWDIHNHILPGIDDGSSCIEETFDLLRREHDQGVRHIVFTPHYWRGRFEISPEERMQVFREVKRIYEQEYWTEIPGMELLLGCELHMHPCSKVPYGDTIYQMPGRKVLLTEFSGRDNFESIRAILQPLLEEGYRCVIAHVERYSLKTKEVAKLKEMEGIYIQCNAGSLLGREGLRARMFSRKLLAKDLVDLIASDAHGAVHRRVCIGACCDWLRVKYGDQKIRTILRENPERLFGENCI